MPGADRTVKVTLSAEVSQYLQAMLKAADAAESVGESSEKSSKKAESAFGRMLQHAEANEQAWTTAGTALTAFGGTIVALGAAALKTGIEYNTLRQTTTAALTSVLGSAEAAADQMDRLDEFARSSPFAKQTFITAQQQMLAFGIEASKVAPYLDSIQNAVAGVGGGNAEIAELATIFAKIQGSAKITAEDLNEFGIRGVNAAQLIGSQMGKTGAQIRDDISNGALDAQTALDALSAGMTANFEGAAAGVKETFAGAVDRVTAAWRDLSAELAEPLVSADGGGALIDLANSLADLLREFEALPEPVKATVAAITGLVGVASLLAGGFLLLLPRARDTVDAFRSFVPEGSKADTSLRRVGKGALDAADGIGKVAVAGSAAILVLDSLTRSSNKTATGIERTTNSLLNLGNSDIDSLFTGLGEDVNNLSDGLQLLAGDSFNSGMERFGSTLNGIFFGGQLQDQVRETTQQVENIGQALAQMVNEGNADEAARQFALIASAAEAQGISVEELTELMPAYAEALAVAEREQSGVAGASQEATASIAAQTAALEEQERAVEEWRATVTAAFQAFIDPSGAFQAAIDKNREFAEATADATESSEDSWEDFYDGQSVTAKQYIAQLRRQVEAQEEWATNMTALTERVRDDMTGDMRAAANQMIDELIELGPEGAAQVALLRELSDKEFATVVELYARRGDAAGTEFTEGVERHRPDIRVETSGALRQIQEVRREIGGLRGKTVTVSVNTIGPSGNTIERFFPRSGLTQKAAGGLVGFAAGGRVPGTPPSDPMTDNVLARTQHGSMYAIRSGEFIQSQPATDYYGLGAMHAINARRIPREVLQGFAAGGQVPTASVAVSASRGTGRPTEVSRTYNNTFISSGGISAREVRQGIRAAEALDFPGGEWA